MPMELLISTGTPRCLAQASWCSLAFFSSKGAMARGGIEDLGIGIGAGTCVLGTEDSALGTVSRPSVLSAKTWETRKPKS